MFAESTSHRQRDLFEDILQSLPEAKRLKALASKEYAFYEEVFCQIDERAFSALFAIERGRPNAPVNAMAGALILREVRRWTFEELFRNLDFDVLTRLALGLSNMSDTPFCPATLFNFQQRIVRYEQEHGTNPFESVFQQLTARQLSRFGVNTTIQRCDSFRAMSNIANYGRVRLLIEVLLRLQRVLTAEDRAGLADSVSAYSSRGSEGYVYRLADDELPRELGKLADIYAQFDTQLRGSYSGVPEYELFKRVLGEQFELSDGGAVRVRERKELTSGVLQSPDDPDATYSVKSGKAQKGHKVNVVETAAPGNTLNLITDVAVTANNVHDGTMLADRMDTLKEQTPDLVEMHTDGGYGGGALEPKMQKHSVLHVETAGRMGHARVNMQYAATGKGGYEVTCPRQVVVAERTPSRWKAVFDDRLCATCPHIEQCRTKAHPGKRTFYFKDSQALSFLRGRNIEQIPKERRKLRANVEATVKEFTGCFNHKGKLRVRGLARTTLQMLAAALAINFGRVFRYQSAEEQSAPPSAVLPATSPRDFLAVIRHLWAALLSQSHFLHSHPEAQQRPARMPSACSITAQWTVQCAK